VKQGSTVVSTFEGIFNVPFYTANTQPPSQLAEETKENFQPASPVQEKVEAKFELPQKLDSDLKLSKSGPKDQSDEVNALTQQLKGIQSKLDESENQKSSAINDKKAIEEKFKQLLTERDLIIKQSEAQESKLKVMAQQNASAETQIKELRQQLEQGNNQN